MTEKYGMKTTAISELQMHFSEYLSYVKSGDEGWLQKEGLTLFS
ncbi:MAG TPA: hypothetical protein PK922_07795 [Syntrophorhabdus sp.]|nr:hypothetical protein [Syntrophorhabdus sp.]